MNVLLQSWCMVCHNSWPFPWCIGFRFPCWRMIRVQGSGTLLCSCMIHLTIHAWYIWPYMAVKKTGVVKQWLDPLSLVHTPHPHTYAHTQGESYLLPKPSTGRQSPVQEGQHYCASKGREVARKRPYKKLKAFLVGAHIISAHNFPKKKICTRLLK